MKRIRVPHLTLMLILPLVFLAGGCLDNEDIDRRVMVSAIGVDRHPTGSIQVDCKMPLILPMGTESKSERRFITRSSVAKGIYPAFIDIQRSIEHTMFVGQCRTVVFGESIARHGLRTALDFFNRMPTFPSSAFMMIARPSAEQILKVTWPEQEVFNQNLRWFFSSKVNRVYSMRNWMVMRNIHDPLQDPVLPIIAPYYTNDSVKMLGLALFRNDRMVGELSAAESNLFVILFHLKEQNPLEIPLGDGRSVAFQVVRGEKRWKVSYHQYPQFMLNLKLKVSIGELIGDHKPLDPKEFEELEEKSARYLERQYLRIFNDLKKLDSDPMGLGHLYRVQQPRHFSLAKWREEYRHAQLRVNVKVFIERLGAIK